MRIRTQTSASSLDQQVMKNTFTLYFFGYQTDEQENYKEMFYGPRDIRQIKAFPSYHLLTELY